MTTPPQVEVAEDWTARPSLGAQLKEVLPDGTEDLMILLDGTNNAVASPQNTVGDQTLWPLVHETEKEESQAFGLAIDGLGAHRVVQNAWEDWALQA